MDVRKKGCVGGFAGIGIDIGHQAFHPVGFDRASQLVRRRQIQRLALSVVIKRFPRCVGGMEAGLGAYGFSRNRQ